MCTIDGGAVDDGKDAATAALDAFIELAPEEQARRLEEETKEQETARLEGQARQKLHERSTLLQKQHALAISASVAVVDAVAPPVPIAHSTKTLAVRFGEYLESANKTAYGIVDQQQMRSVLIFVSFCLAWLRWLIDIGTY
jgi:hypothetical protein